VARARVAARLRRTVKDAANDSVVATTNVYSRGACVLLRLFPHLLHLHRLLLAVAFATCTIARLVYHAKRRNAEAPRRRAQLEDTILAVFRSSAARTTRA